MKLFLLTAFLLLTTGCSSDISVHEQRETRVVVDSYIQPDRLDKLDVLVALDTSGSMTDNYDDVADGMDILRGDIESLTLDYQFGYITMDPNRLSYLGPYDSSSTAIDMLMAPSLLPMTSLEEGFSATYSFFSSVEPYDFSRPEADFLLFLISDEDEQSNTYFQSTNEFVSWVSAYRQSAFVSSIINLDPAVSMCDHTSLLNVGNEYIAATNHFNGQIIDICDEDWSAGVLDASNQIAPHEYWDLNYLPLYDDRIYVFVDGVPFNDWYYEPAENRVYFTTLPDGGSLVEVAYYYQ